MAGISEEEDVMPNERIEVISYEGYREEETPRALVLRGKRIEIVDTEDMWIEEGIEDGARKRSFKVRGSDGVVRAIFRDERTREWFVRKGGTRTLP